MQVGELVSRDVITLRADDSITRLLEVLAESSQDVFPVVDGAGKVVGTVSEMELIRVVGPSRRTFPWGPRKLVREGLVGEVEDVMTPRPATVRPGDPAADALRKMQELAIPQMVVVDDDGRLVGLLRGRELFRVYVRGAE